MRWRRRRQEKSGERRENGSDVINRSTAFRFHFHFSCCFHRVPLCRHLLTHSHCRTHNTPCFPTNSSFHFSLSFFSFLSIHAHTTTKSSAAEAATTLNCGNRYAFKSLSKAQEKPLWYSNEMKRMRKCELYGLLDMNWPTAEVNRTNERIHTHWMDEMWKYFQTKKKSNQTNKWILFSWKRLTLSESLMRRIVNCAWHVIRFRINVQLNSYTSSLPSFASSIFLTIHQFYQFVFCRTTIYSNLMHRSTWPSSPPLLPLFSVISFDVFVRILRRWDFVSRVWPFDLPFVSDFSSWCQFRLFLELCAHSQNKKETIQCLLLILFFWISHAINSIYRSSVFIVTDAKRKYFFR